MANGHVPIAKLVDVSFEGKTLFNTNLELLNKSTPFIQIQKEENQVTPALVRLLLVTKVMKVSVLIEFFIFSLNVPLVHFF